MIQPPFSCPLFQHYGLFKDISCMRYVLLKTFMVLSICMSLCTWIVTYGTTLMSWNCHWDLCFKFYSDDSLRIYFLNKNSLSHFYYRYIISHWACLTHSSLFPYFRTRCWLQVVHLYNWRKRNSVSLTLWSVWASRLSLHLIYI